MGPGRICSKPQDIENQKNHLWVVLYFYAARIWTNLSQGYEYGAASGYFNRSSISGHR